MGWSLGWFLGAVFGERVPSGLGSKVGYEEYIFDGLSVG
jgi:hypothetical protein